MHTFSTSKIWKSTFSGNKAVFGRCRNKYFADLFDKFVGKPTNFETIFTRRWSLDSKSVELSRTYLRRNKKEEWTSISLIIFFALTNMWICKVFILINEKLTYVHGLTSISLFVGQDRLLARVFQSEPDYCLDLRRQKQWWDPKDYISTQVIEFLFLFFSLKRRNNE